MNKFAEYRALVDKVDEFAHRTNRRYAAQINCRAGCTGCCQVKLTLNEVEAAVLQNAIAALPFETRSRVASQTGEDSCALLQADGRCAAYESRPLVCRSQGLPLRYPTGWIPESSLRRRISNGDVTWCPLNFEDAAAADEDVLDAERVDAILAVIDQRYCAAVGTTPGTRRAIDDLVRECTSL